MRAMYLYAGVADVVLETGDASLWETLERLWQNLVGARMYITGGVGSQAHGERFTTDFDLPNDRAYTESCASIGLVFWAHRMIQIKPRGFYGDVLERALYNNILAGISLSGTEYFYANPLRVDPIAVRYREDLKHVSVVRQRWFGVACCPTNIARLICSLGHYIYSSNDNELFVHLYMESEAEVASGRWSVKIKQETGYPWTDSVVITLNPSDAVELTMAIRLPSWCRDPRPTVNDEPPLDARELLRDGYIYIRRNWRPGDRVRLDFSMRVERVAADPRVAENVGRVAFQRGPFIYCLEETDNGGNLFDLAVPRETTLVEERRPDLLGGVVTISGPAVRGGHEPARGNLYGPPTNLRSSTRFTAVPYCTWCNRTPGEMIVWIREV